MTHFLAVIVLALCVAWFGMVAIIHATAPPRTFRAHHARERRRIRRQRRDLDRHLRGNHLR